MQYSIKKFIAIESPNEKHNRYSDTFGLHDTGSNKNTNVQCFVAMSGNESKTENEICQLAFSGSFSMISGASGRLVSSDTVAPSWDATGSMFVPDL